MTDIVERLRRLYVDAGTNHVQEAADTIESLRTKVAFLEQDQSIPAGWQLARTDDIKFCIDAIREWGAYASAYAVEKWNLAGDIKRAKAMLAAPKP